MLIDLKIYEGEILWENGGCVMAEGADCVVQNLITRLITDRGALFYDPNYGEGLLRFLHSPADEKTILELEGALSRALRSQPYVEEGSEMVKTSAQGGALKAEISFMIGGEPISLLLEWGDDFTWAYQGEINDI